MNRFSEKEASTPQGDVALVSYLMRPAGLGVSRAQPGQSASWAYGAAVDDLPTPGTFIGIEEDVWKSYNAKLSHRESLIVSSREYQFA